LFSLGGFSCLFWKNQIPHKTLKKMPPKNVQTPANGSTPSQATPVNVQTPANGSTSLQAQPVSLLSDVQTPANGSTSLQAQPVSLLSDVQSPANGNTSLQVQFSGRVEELQTPANGSTPPTSQNDQTVLLTPANGSTLESQPMSRTQELALVRSLNLEVGSRVRVTWRSQETALELSGPWLTTEVTVVSLTEDDVGRTRYLTSFINDEGEEYHSTLPLEFPCETAAMARVKTQGRSPLAAFGKRARLPEREESSHHVTEETQISQGQGNMAQAGTAMDTFITRQATAQAQAQLDVNRGTVTVEVARGDGLRVPAHVCQIWRPLYPNYWLQRRDNGESAVALEREWRDELLTLQAYLGSSFRSPSRREAYLTNVENLIGIIFRATPQSRSAWRPCFSNSILVLRDFVCSCHSAKAGEETGSKFVEAWNKNFINMEALYLVTSTGTTVETDPTMALEDSRSVLAAENRALKAQLASAVANTNNNTGSFFHGGRRGRGSGGGYRGRGKSDRGRGRGAQ
jgi:hypothetical protein